MTVLAHSAGPGTPRTRLARLAAEAALAVDGVLGVDAGPHGMHVTGERGSLVRGVRVIAEPGGRHSVDLGLLASPVPLLPLGGQVRERVQAAARSAGLQDQLGEISVTFHDVLDADQAALLATPRTEEPR